MGISPPEVVELTRQYTDAVRELRDALNERDDILRECRRQNISPRPGHFATNTNRIHAARQIVAMLKQALDTALGGGQ